MDDTATMSQYGTCSTPISDTNSSSIEGQHNKQGHTSTTTTTCATISTTRKSIEIIFNCKYAFLFYFTFSLDMKYIVNTLSHQLLSRIQSFCHPCKPV